ncbi:MAG: carbon monoxide dehydrogenase [Cyclobacteriaceae bacterium]|nr:MAG: carbon monoxide dehydrogenase [Cyclobacteriaceae bacterium]
MIPSEFEYFRAGSVKEALELLNEKGPDAKILAGGHSLIPAMKLRFNNPGALIDIGGISELNYIREENDVLAIGAATTHADLAASGLLNSSLPMLAETAATIGDIQVRNKGTIGGSLAHADPAADWPAALLAAEAEVIITSRSESRVVAIADFFQGLFTTDLGDAELITEIRVPLPPANTRSTYLKFEQPASRFAIVGCAAMVTRNNGSFGNVRVAFTGVSASPFRDHGIEQALEGQPADGAQLHEACKLAGNGVDVMGDHFASKEYRTHLAVVFAERALKVVTGQG